MSEEVEVKATGITNSKTIGLPIGATICDENGVITGTLEDWWVDQCTKKEFIIYGNLFGDHKGRFQDGTNIHTSGIKNRKCEEGDVVSTRNSRYLLGKKYTDVKNEEEV